MKLKIFIKKVLRQLVHNGTINVTNYELSISFKQNVTTSNNVYENFKSRNAKKFTMCTTNMIKTILLLNVAFIASFLLMIQWAVHLYIYFFGSTFLRSARNRWCSSQWCSWNWWMKGGWKYRLKFFQRILIINY